MGEETEYKPKEEHVQALCKVVDVLAIILLAAFLLFATGCTSRSKAYAWPNRCPEHKRWDCPPKESQAEDDTFETKTPRLP